MTTERDLLRDLEAALDVSPSPDFEARVRERVRAESMGVSRWTWPTIVAVAATLVLAVMVVHSRQSPTRLELTRPEVPIRQAPAPSVTNAGQRSQPSGAVRRATSRPHTRRAGAPADPSRASPVVVVPAGQMAAIQRLMHEVAAGRVVMGPERPAPPGALQVSALVEAPPIEFDTIRFTPLSADASPDLWR